MSRLKIAIVAVLLLCPLPLLAQASGEDCVKRHVAFDIGSETTKVKIAAVDTCGAPIRIHDPVVGTVIELRRLFGGVIYENAAAVGYSDSLARQAGRRFEDEVLSKGLEAIQSLKSEIDSLSSLQPARYLAVATAAFRELALFIADPTTDPKIIAEQRAAKAQLDDFFGEVAAMGIEVAIVSPRLEAAMGLAGVALREAATPKNWLVWDIGGGSMQMVMVDARNNLTFNSAQLGSTAFRQEVAMAVKLFSEDEVGRNPNPMSLTEVEGAVKLAEKLVRAQLPEVTTRFRALQGEDEDYRVIGIGGVHRYAVRGQMVAEFGEPVDPITPEKVRNLLFQKRVDWNGDLDKPWGPTQVTNPALVLGGMQALGVEEVEVMDINLADGLLVGPALGGWGIPESAIYR